MTTALVIGRQRPGRPIAEGVHDVGGRLEAAGWSVTTAVVKRKQAMRKRVGKAVKAEVDAVVVVGGDGAVLQAVQRLAETSVALGIIPMGTGNLLATNLGIPKRQGRAVDVLLGDGRRTIDLGRAEVGGKQRFFSVACGVGFDAEVLDGTPMREKRRWGKLAYAASAIKARGKLREVRHSLLLDGKDRTMDASQVFIANFGNMGLGFKPRLEIAPDDGKLDVIAIRATVGPHGLLAFWEALRQRRPGKSSSGRVLRARAETVEIGTETKRLVELDGSVVGTTPVAVSVHPAALLVIAPDAPKG